MNLDLLNNAAVVSNKPARKGTSLAAMTVRTGVRAGGKIYERAY